MVTRVSASSDAPSANVWRIVTNATATGTGRTFSTSGCERAIRALVSGTGAVSASVDLYGSTEDSTTAGVFLGTLSPSGTTSAAAGMTIAAPWPYIFAVVTAISGTGATINVDVAT